MWDRSYSTPQLDWSQPYFGISLNCGTGRCRRHRALQCVHANFVKEVLGGGVTRKGWDGVVTGVTFGVGLDQGLQLLGVVRLKERVHNVPHGTLSGRVKVLLDTSLNFAVESHRRNSSDSTKDCCDRKAPNSEEARQRSGAARCVRGTLLVGWFRWCVLLLLLN